MPLSSPVILRPAGMEGRTIPTCLFAGIEDTAEDAKLSTDHHHVNLPVLLDPDGKAFKAFDVQGVPVAILVGENDKFVHCWVRLDDLSAMHSVLSATLQAHPVSAGGSEQHR